MVSDFALALSFEGIGLLRRMGTGWALIGDVPIDHPDLDVAVIALRDKAESLDPKGAEVALVIPNEQIRYLDLPDPGGDAESRDLAIRTALHGATPYDLSELTWDQVVSAGRLQIAAVAKDTLAEAETFARDHGFTPTCHMARAPKASEAATGFDGPVFFGAASDWGRAVSRPSRAVEIILATPEALLPVVAEATSEVAAPVAPPEPETTPEPEAPAAAFAPLEEPPVMADPAPVEASPAEAPHAAPGDVDGLATEDARFWHEEDSSSEPDLPLDGTPEPQSEHPTEQLPQATPEPEAEILSATEPQNARPADAGHATPVAEAATKDAEQDVAPAMTFASSRHTAPEDVVLDAPAAPLTTLRPRFTPIVTEHLDAHLDDGARERAIASGASRVIETAGDIELPEPKVETEEAKPLSPAPAVQRADTPVPTPPVAAPESAADLPAVSAPVAKAPVAPAPDALSTAATTAPALGAARRDDPDHVTTPRPLAGADRSLGNDIAPRGPAPLTPSSDRQTTPVPPLAVAAATSTDADAPAPKVSSPAKPPQDARRSRRLGLRRKDRTKDATDAPSGPDGGAPLTRKVSGSTSPAIAAIATSSASAPRGATDPLARLAALRRPAIDGPAMALPRAPVVTPDLSTVAPLAPLAVPPKPEDIDLDALPDTARIATPAAPGSAPALADPALDDVPPMPVAPGPVAAPVDRKAPAPSKPAKPAKPSKANPLTNRDERDRLTVFGERNRPAAKPRYLGLALTAGLLLGLLGIGAWSTVFMGDGVSGLFGGDPAPEEVASVDVPAADPGTNPGTSPAEDVVLLPQDSAPTAPIVPQDTEQAAATPQAPSRPATPVGESPSPAEAAASYAATGIWQRAPAAPMTPAVNANDDLYVASIDPDVQVFDAIAMPRLAATALRPNPVDPGLPPPPGMTFDIDPRGVVRATPEGALTPDGLRVYTGRPPVVPPLRDPVTSSAGTTATPVALPVPEQATDQPAETATPPVEAPAAEVPPLGRIRPEARPDDVVEQQERATMGGISREELAAFRPQIRPETAQEQAEAATPEATATEQAVRASLQPVGRPRNMSAIVERAEQERPAQPVQTAAVAPVAPATVTPSIPSSTSVAASATVRNAIRLNRINLIGVYGTPANRRALVRLANGKYLKVKVGDTLDGGRVAAIGESELRYSKGGRNVTLQMPRG